MPKLRNRQVSMWECFRLDSYFLPWSRAELMKYRQTNGRRRTTAGPTSGSRVTLMWIALGQQVYGRDQLSGNLTVGSLP